MDLRTDEKLSSDCEFDPAAHAQYLEPLQPEIRPIERAALNMFLLEQQRKELLSLAAYPQCRLRIPSATKIEVMDQGDILGALKAISDRVSGVLERMKLLGVVRRPVQAVLENPIQLLLLTALDRLLSQASDPQAFFFKKKHITETMTAIVNSINGILYETKEVYQAIQGGSVTAGAAPVELGFLEKLYTATDPENFRQALVEEARRTIATGRTIEKEVQRICLFTKELLDGLEPYLKGLGMEKFGKLHLFPRGMEQKNWLQEIEDFHERIRPFVYLVERIREHLKPYQDRTIRPESEDQFRPELRAWLLPMFRQNFPGSRLTDEEVQLFILSAYLREGLAGWDQLSVLQTIKNLLEDGIGGYKEVAKQKVLSVEEHREAYPKALKHALRIDFRSMDLTDQEIEFLADSAITNVSFLVPADWRNQFRPQPTPRPNSIGPSDRTSPHLP